MACFCAEIRHPPSAIRQRLPLTVTRTVVLPDGQKTPCEESLLDPPLPRNLIQRAKVLQERLAATKQALQASEKQTAHCHDELARLHTQVTHQHILVHNERRKLRRAKHATGRAKVLIAGLQDHIVNLQMLRAPSGPADLSRESARSRNAMPSSCWKDQLELHQRRGVDVSIPLKTHLKTKAARYEALLAAVERCKAQHQYDSGNRGTSQMTTEACRTLYSTVSEDGSDGSDEDSI